MSAIEELLRLVEDETLLYRDIKTQYADYSTKKVVVWSTNEEFLTALLYDLFDGHVFGAKTVVDVVLLVEEDQVHLVETVYCNYIISGLPKFKGLKVSSVLEDMKNSDYLILHHEVDWGPADKRKTRMDIIKEQFASLRMWGMKINRCLSEECQVLLLGDMLSVSRLILGLYTPNLPHQNIHGLTRHYERAANSILANKLKIPMREIKGVGVFGEDIVESTNSRIGSTIEDHEDEVYEESIKAYMPEIYEIMKLNDEIESNTIEELSKPNMNETTKINAEAKRENVEDNDSPTVKDKIGADVDYILPERKDYPPFGIPYTTDETPGSYINAWHRVALDRGWLAESIGGLHELPVEWTTESRVTNLMNFRPPVKGIQWVLGRLADEKFHCYTLPRKCKSDQSGYSLARGVSDYIIFLLKESSQPKMTNALACSAGEYNVPAGMFLSFPVTLGQDSKYRIIKGYKVSETTYMRLNEQIQELEKEYNFILELYKDFPDTTEASETSSNESINEEGVEEHGEFGEGLGESEEFKFFSENRKRFK